MALRSSFRDLELEVGYSGRGRDILARFVLPVLRLSIAYDRVTSYFSVDSLLAVSPGVDELYRRGGTMRLIVGLHDVRDSELAQAAARKDQVLEAQIERVRREIVEKARSIGDELTARRLATLAWMMCDGLLTVRVAWLPGSGGVGGGIFHSKSYVLQDQQGNILAATGSQNETVPGLGDNWEKISVFASWNESREHALHEQTEFEQLWNGHTPGLLVRELDTAFAESLLVSLPVSCRERPGPRPAQDLEYFLYRVSRLPAFFPLAGPAALFPHQERAHIDALSRWPIRVMLADEVGLGKTFEAGSVVRYAIESCGVQRVLVLAPKAVLRQWQSELHEHFRLSFWRYESDIRCYVSPTGDSIGQRKGQPVLSEESPVLLLVSSQYARGDARRQDLFSSADVLPDMVVVDEAHAARLISDASGRGRATRLLRALRDAVRSHIQHLVLVTATPLQLDWREYHVSLDLLGLPPLWRDQRLYWESLSLLAGTSPMSLQSAGTCVALLKDSVAWYQLALSRFDPRDRSLLQALLREDSSFRMAALAQKHWDSALRLLAYAHPGALLTVRNTRSALMALGYRFPRRELSGPRMEVSNALRALYEGIERYLANAYYSIERARHPNKRVSRGFVLSSYQQRLASTLAACRLTLQRRLEKAHRAMSSLSGDDDDGFDDMDLAYWEDPGECDAEPTDGPMVAQAANLEYAYLLELVALCDKALENGDPKISALMKLLEMTLPGDRVLVFSRYTESLDACIDAFNSRFSKVPYACFTGEQSWIDMGDGRWPCTRGTIREYLFDDKVKVVFCSDAASEGINLQAARVLINVDVPWNPARLEQRIGRIARLGQTASVVDIHNLWYPGSVEERIYGRLMARKELFELAVGEFPDIIARAIREECADPLSPCWSEALAHLEALRRDQQLQAMKKVWQFGSIGNSRSEEVRKRLHDFLTDQSRSLGIDVNDLPTSYVAGERNVVSLTHRAVLALRFPLASDVGPSAELGFLTANGADIGLAVNHEGFLWVIGPESVPDLLAGLVLRKPFRLDLELARTVPDLCMDPAEVNRLFPWSPDHWALRFGETPTFPLLTGPIGFSPVDGMRIPVAVGAGAS